jgi:hypothetical protein
MKLAFYKSKYGNWADKGIDWWTGGHGYSHCEIVFSDGMSFSASQRDNITRFKDITYNEKWDLVELDIDEMTENIIRAKAEGLQGKKYDWIGIVLHQGIFKGLYLNFMQSDGKWWCSEICSYLLWEGNFRVDPNTLAIRHGL